MALESSSYHESEQRSWETFEGFCEYIRGLVQQQQEHHNVSQDLMRVNPDKLTDEDWKIFVAIHNNTLTIEQFNEYNESLVSNDGNGDAGIGAFIRNMANPLMAGLYEQRNKELDLDF